MDELVVSKDLDRLLRGLRLGQMRHTLPERAAMAKQSHLSHLGFLQVVLEDESARRDNVSAGQRALKAGLDRSMRADLWQDLSDLSYDRQVWSDLLMLPFVESTANVLVLGPVGVGKTHLATALGLIAVRRRVPTVFYRADKLFHRLRAARLDNTLHGEIRRLSTIGLLLIDDFALRMMDETSTSDFYELVVERHGRYPMIITSNRDPSEWIGQMSDTLLAQAAVDRLTAGAHVLIVDGPSYRQRHAATPVGRVDQKGRMGDAL